jgi:general secretion pathway protein K
MHSNTSRGSALLSALFLMTLIAIAATAMSTRLQIDIYRTRRMIESDKMQLAGEAIIFWAMDRLLDPALQVRSLNDSGKILNYPGSLQDIYPDMKLTGSVYDLQARFNINNLQSPLFAPMFLKLLGNNMAKVEMNVLKSISRATLHWVNAYQPGRGMDDLMTYYSQQTPSYYPGFQSMQSVTEFRLVAGVSAAGYESIRPYITALPTLTQINLNTASPKILQTLGNGLSDAKLNELLAFRSAKGVFDEKDFPHIISQFHIPASQLSIQSQYFLCIGTVKSTDLKLDYYVTFQRIKNRSGGYEVHVLSETLNTD